MAIGLTRFGDIVSGVMNIGLFTGNVTGYMVGTSSNLLVSGVPACVSGDMCLVSGVLIDPVGNVMNLVNYPLSFIGTGLLLDNTKTTVVGLENTIQQVGVVVTAGSGA